MKNFSLNEKYPIKGSYILINCVVVVLLLLVLFIYKGLYEKRDTKLEATENVVELLQKDYKKTIDAYQIQKAELDSIKSLNIEE